MPRRLKLLSYLYSCCLFCFSSKAVLWKWTAFVKSLGIVCFVINDKQFFKQTKNKNQALMEFNL